MEGRGVEDLRADVAADSGDAQVRQRLRMATGVERAPVGDAELVGGKPGGDVRVRSRVDVGVDAQRYRCHAAHRCRHRLEAVELGLALDVEAADARGESRAHLAFGLADAGEDHAAGIATGGKHARELPARNDVEARAGARQDLEHGEVGVGLDRVADEMVDAREPLVEIAKRRFERGAGVHVAGSAEAPRDFGEREAVERELARGARERIHGAGEAGLGGSGSLSGPFLPPPPSGAAATAGTAGAGATRAISTRNNTETESHTPGDAP